MGVSVCVYVCVMCMCVCDVYVCVLFAQSPRQTDVTLLE